LLNREGWELDLDSGGAFGRWWRRRICYSLGFHAEAPLKRRLTRRPRAAQLAQPTLTGLARPLVPVARPHLAVRARLVAPVAPRTPVAPARWEARVGSAASKILLSALP